MSQRYRANTELLTFVVSWSVLSTGFKTALTTSVALFPVISNVKNSLCNGLQSILGSSGPSGGSSSAKSTKTALVILLTKAGLLTVGWRRRRIRRMRSSVADEDEGTSQMKVAGPISSGREAGV